MIVKDQNGVVWIRGDEGCAVMAREAYEELRGDDLDLPAYDDLAVWNSHDQNIVEVD